MLPSECAEIFCKFAEFLARNVENNVCPPEYADVKSYVNARALKALGEIDRVDAEAAAKVFPVKMAETVRGYDIW